MSIKILKTLRNYEENLQSQIHDLQFFKTLTFLRKGSLKVTKSNKF